MFLTLCYHIIDRTIRDEIAIEEEAFESQLAYLREHDYCVLSLEQAIDDAAGRRAAPPRAFAYPYGRYNQAVQEVVSQHYEVAFAVEKGSWDVRGDRYAINRMMVLPSWSLEEFGEQLNRHFAPDKTTAIHSALEEVER